MSGDSSNLNAPLNPSENSNDANNNRESRGGGSRPSFNPFGGSGVRVGDN